MTNLNMPLASGVASPYTAKQWHKERLIIEIDL